MDRTSYEDTYNTLKYADRAKSIRVRAERNEVNVNHHVSQYINIIEALRQEISELKDQVKQANESKVLAMSQQPVLVRETKEGLFEHHHLFAELLWSTRTQPCSCTRRALSWHGSLSPYRCWRLFLDRRLLALVSFICQFKRRVFFKNTFCCCCD